MPVQINLKFVKLIMFCLVICSFLISLPAPVYAPNRPVGSGPFGDHIGNIISVIGIDGTAYYSGFSVKVSSSFRIGVTEITTESIEGKGIGQLSFARGAQDLAIITDLKNSISLKILWSFNRIDKSLNIIGRTSAESDDILFLSGTVVRNPSEIPRATVELSGILFWQTEIVSLEIIDGSLIGETDDDYRS